MNNNEICKFFDCGDGNTCKYHDSEYYEGYGVACFCRHPEHINTQLLIQDIEDCPESCIKVGKDGIAYEKKW